MGRGYLAFSEATQLLPSDTALAMISSHSPKSLGFCQQVEVIWPLSRFPPTAQKVIQLVPETYFPQPVTSLGLYQHSFLQFEIIPPLPRFLPAIRNHSISAKIPAHSPKSLGMCQAPSHRPKSFGFCQDLFSHSLMSLHLRQDFFPQPEVIRLLPRLPTARSHSAAAKISSRPAVILRQPRFIPTARYHSASARTSWHTTK